MTSFARISPSDLKRRKFSKSTLRFSKRNRELGVLIHSAWKNYEKNLYNNLISLNKIDLKVHGFEKIMNETRDKTIKMFENSKYLQEISRFLHTIIQRIRKLIKNITFNSKIRIKDFIIQYFEGNPDFEVDLQFKVDGIEIKGRIDQLITTQDSKLIIKDLKPDFSLVEDINKNPSLFQVAIYAYLAEMSLSKKCTKIVLIDYNLQIQEILFDIELRAQILYEIKKLINGSSSNFIRTHLNYNQTKEIKNESSSTENKKVLQSDDKKDKELRNLIRENDNFKIGWCIARRSKKPNLSIRSFSKIKGYIEDAQKLRVIPGIYVVIEFSNDSDILNSCNSEYKVRIISKIINIKPYTDSISLIKNSTSENIIEVEIEPLFEISQEDGYLGQVRPHIFDQAAIRFCLDEEIIELLKVPTEGFVMGEIEGYGDRSIKYKLPYQKLEESVCILGTQGTGKTTLIYAMVCKFSGDLNLLPNERPSIVILDIESEYQNFNNVDFKLSNEGFFKKFEISNEIQIHKYKIGYDNDNYTLDLSVIEPEEYIYFIPNLTTKTSEAYISIATKIREDLLKSHNFSKNNLIQGIKNYINSGKTQYLHPSTIQAVLRACDAKNFELFNRPECKNISINDFIRPGTINIIDVFELSDQEQRIVALYFMLVFYRAKMKSEKNSKNILALVIDEAHRIFPRTSNISAEKDYIDRIVSKVSEITHRGRKRHYGVIFATQSPKDLKKEIMTTCNTKIFFRIAGETILLSEILEKHNIKEIANLPVGIGVITCQGIHKPIKVRFPYLNIK